MVGDLGSYYLSSNLNVMHTNKVEHVHVAFGKTM